MFPFYLPFLFIRLKNLADRSFRCKHSLHFSFTRFSFLINRLTRYHDLLIFLFNMHALHWQQQRLSLFAAYKIYVFMVSVINFDFFQLSQCQFTTWWHDLLLLILAINTFMNWIRVLKLSSSGPTFPSEYSPFEMSNTVYVFGLLSFYVRVLLSLARVISSSFHVFISPILKKRKKKW